MIHDKFVRVSGPPPVQISYPHPARQNERVELPFVVGVLADLSGNANGRDQPGLQDRLFTDVNRANFDAVLSALEPGVAVAIDGRQIVELRFRSLDDFRPEAVAGRVPALSGLFADPSRADHMRVDAILDAPPFQALESAWRGLRHLVDNVPDESAVTIRVFDVSRAELARCAKRYPGESWRQSPIVKRVHDDIFGVVGAAPFSCLVADFAFSHAAEDVELLEHLARIADAAHAPLLTAADSRLLGIDRWADLGSVDLEAAFDGADHAAWNRLRDQQICRFVGLCGPRLLAHPPHEEGSGRALWMNAAYAMAVNVAAAFGTFGWPALFAGLESGGLVRNLPRVEMSRHDGATLSTFVLNPVEGAVNERQEALLGKAGILAGLARKDSSEVVFFSARSLHRPQPRDTPEAQVTEHLLARLPLMFTASRVALHLQCMARDHRSIAGLDDWLQGYVDAEQVDRAVLNRQHRPLSAASVEVKALEASGLYMADLSITPYYQFVGSEAAVSFKLWLAT